MKTKLTAATPKESKVEREIVDKKTVFTQHVSLITYHCFQYRFTGKEQDATGLYYFGARYYDPWTSMWLSTDKALVSYLDSVGKGGSKSNENGIFDSKHLALYAYGDLNPMIMIDPDGKWSYRVGSAHPTGIPGVSRTFGIIFSDKGMATYNGLSFDVDILHWPINFSYSPAPFEPGTYLTGDLGVISPDLDQLAKNTELSILDFKDKTGKINWSNFAKGSSYGWNGFGVGIEKSELIKDVKTRCEEDLKKWPGHEQGIYPQILEGPTSDGKIQK